MGEALKERVFEKIYSIDKKMLRPYSFQTKFLRSSEKSPALFFDLK